MGMSKTSISMPAQRHVSFQAGLQSPSHHPNFLSDLASSDDGDGASEKNSPIEMEKGFEEGQGNWAQRPKSMPWTSRPQSLRERLRVRWWRDVMVDTFSILMPVPFLILSGVILVINGKEADDWSLKVLQTAIQASTTIFPIFFAGLVGRATIKFATWKLEQGSSLGLLEQLMGSRTVISTITTQFRLRSYNLIGLGLVVLWFLSPLGSQAVLHILESPLVPNPSDTEVTYINARQQSYAAPTGAFLNSWYAGYTMLFGASLLAPTTVKMSTMDLWGNVKIPYMSSVLNSSGVTDENCWTYLPSDFNPTYSSLFGIPISGISIGNTTFTMESSYVSLSCGNMTTENLSNGQQNLVKTNLISPNGPFIANSDVPDTAPWALGYRGLDITSFNNSIYNSSAPFAYPQSCPDCLPLTTTFTQSSTQNIVLDPGTLLYQEYDQLDNATSIFCTPSMAYTESLITCSFPSTALSPSCRVTAQRPSTLPHPPSTLTPLSFSTVLKGITSLLPSSTPQKTLTNPIQYYIYSSPTSPQTQTNIISASSSIGLLGIPGQESPIYSLPLSDFSDRFGQIINSFLFASAWNMTPYITGAPFSGLIETPLGGHAASFVPATSPSQLYELIQNRTSAFTVPATITTNKRIFKVSYPWIALFLLSIVCMLFSAIAGVWYSRNTNVPDYLGYVSTLAKESPWVRMPDGGVTLDGMERARKMKHLKVRLGNVNLGDRGGGGYKEGGVDGVGKLAFARTEDTGVVRKDGLYV